MTGQTLRVKSPQYTLPNGAIHSHFPASHDSAFAEILPHVVLTDPLMPWERSGLKNNETRNRMPWLALLVFSEHELLLQESLRNGHDSMFKNTTLQHEVATVNKQIQQSSTFTLNMLITDFAKVTRSSSPVPAPDDVKDRGDAIFVKKQLFDLLTTTYDQGGEADPNQTNADITRYQYLAHVQQSDRSIGHVPLAVVLSHRTGPLLEHQSSRAIVHLVSLEGWSEVKLKDLRDSQTTEYVALLSLYSWAYHVLPTSSMSIAESFQQISTTHNVLRVSDDILDQAKAATSPAASRVYNRLVDGYTLTKYRTQTGEETAAIIRGALTPTPPPKDTRLDWASTSLRSSTDLHILDQELGLVDLTYSAAWDLGRTLALSDGAFVTSLSQLRSLSATFALALKAAQHEELLAKKRSISQRSTKNFPTDPVTELVSSVDRGIESPVSGGTDRNDTPSDDKQIDPSRAEGRTASDSRATDKEAIYFSGGEGKAFLHELNSSGSSEWKVIRSWVADKHLLVGVPAQQLIVDQSLLPGESLRTFYVDPRWVEALVDGALSVGYQPDEADGQLRRMLKRTLDAHFDSVNVRASNQPLKLASGFLLRSHLVKNFPDMHVAIAASSPGLTGSVAADDMGHDNALVLRQEKLVEDTLLCLLDGPHGSVESNVITFAQPAHHQYFVVGEKISSEKLEIRYKQASAEAQAGGSFGHVWAQTCVVKAMRGSSRSGAGSDGPDPAREPVHQLFVWGEKNQARFLNLSALMADILSCARRDSGGVSDDTIPTAALVGFQLTCTPCQLVLKPKH